MDFISIRRKAFQILTVASLAAVLSASLATGATEAARTSTPGLSGPWSGTYGGTFSGTFKLNWTQTASKLRGSSKLQGSITITYKGQSKKTNVTGKVSGGAISFGAVGPVGVISYTGTASGTPSMSGQYKTPAGGGTWSARQDLLRDLRHGQASERWGSTPRSACCCKTRTERRPTTSTRCSERAHSLSPGFLIGHPLTRLGALDPADHAEAWAGVHKIKPASLCVASSTCKTHLRCRRVASYPARGRRNRPAVTGGERRAG